MATSEFGESDPISSKLSDRTYKVMQTALGIRFPRNLRVGFQEFDYGNTLAAAVRVKMLEGGWTETNDIQYVPANWFAALLQAMSSLAGLRWLRRWLVPKQRAIVRSIRHYHVCPHVDSGERDRAHFEFLDGPCPLPDPRKE